MKKIGFLSVFISIACSAQAASQAPLWEAGIGIAGVTLPDYRGAEQQQNLLLPIPYFVYRGEHLKIDRQAVRNLLYETEHSQIDISIAGAPPVRSKNNHARAGMPDLLPTLEVGPSFVWKITETPSQQWRLLLPVRAVLAANLKHSQGAGFVFAPRLNWNHRAIATNDWNLGAAVGLSFANQTHHDYFYAVSAADATANRPAYASRAGYSGANLVFSANRRVGNIWFGGFVRLDDLHGAAFADSPLVKRKNNISAGLGVSWIFGASSEQVAVNENEF